MADIEEWKEKWRAATEGIYRRTFCNSLVTLLFNNAVTRGVHPPPSQWCILHIHIIISAKFRNIHHPIFVIFKSFILTCRACLIDCRQGHCVHVYISELIRYRRHWRYQQRHLAKPDATTHRYWPPDATTHTLTLTTTLSQNLTLSKMWTWAKMWPWPEIWPWPKIWPRPKIWSLP